mmetsp:Transcript_15784/g.48154  ORF Transcript_15784/g.48154 Transcript_15784/m.48154 type:complete len:130 (-) Transcript_15784:1232-1621(-)
MAAMVAAADAAADINVEETLLCGRNERGIPDVRFIDDVDFFLASELNGTAVETVIGAYTTLLSKFRTYEVNLMQQRMKAKLRVPEIEKTLTLIEQLKTKREVRAVDKDKSPASCLQPRSPSAYPSQNQI